MTKYFATPTIVDGIRFASRKEARRYVELTLLERAGEITNLQLQVSYDLHALGGATVARYVSDFVYVETANGEEIVEDVKGSTKNLLPMYRLKRRWMLAEHGIAIREVYS
jgi:hypothetical protein